MDYPPVGGMLALHGQGEDESYLQMAMEYLKNTWMYWRRKHRQE